LRSILITGANRGIGKAIALKVLKEGNNISLGVRSPESIKGSELDPIIHDEGKVIVNYYDALKKDSIQSWVNNTRDCFGKIDTIIHCAGIFKNTKLLFPENEYKDIEKLWRINLLGPWLLTRAAWKDLEDDGNGRVQVLVSMSGKRSKSGFAGYSTSKFALMGLCETMRNEGWEKGIRVSAICPGWVNTDMSRGVNSIPKQQMTQPEDIAAVSSLLLKLPKSSVPFDIPINCILEK
tara:strand:+ start:294 stop:1001 length:708 start_codon:yes stop_codon:yes gene_type:complete